MTAIFSGWERRNPLLCNINTYAVKSQSKTMQPRIYTYKITFEEVPYYYYGSKKEKRYDEYYMGSPKRNKWCWELYTPKKQILEFFDYSDEGYEECRKVEDRLIKSVLNDFWCLNEAYGGNFSLNTKRNNGKLCYENNIGCFSINSIERSKISRKTGQKNYKDKKGCFSLTKEERIGLSKKIGSKFYEEKLGIFSLSFEEKSIIAKRNCEQKIGCFSLTKEERSQVIKKVNSQRWMCLETGYVTNAGALTRYQKARGIDISKRKRIA